MPNMDSIISNHNRRILSPTVDLPANTRNRNKPDHSTPISTTTELHSHLNTLCNCRGGTHNCPLGGYYLSKSIIYQAEVISDHKTAVYIGLASNTFKERYRNHMSSFRNVRYKESTAMSNYIWKLKEENIQFEVKW